MKAATSRRRRFGMLAAMLAFGIVSVSGQGSPAAGSAIKASVLVHVTQGPEQPTRAALAFLVARTAIEEGHRVTLFLAGDAVQSRASMLMTISSAEHGLATVSAPTSGRRRSP